MSNPTPRRPAQSADGAWVPEEARDPWAQYGWVMQAVWVVFLVFPLLEILLEQRPPWAKVAGTSLVAAFGACYVIGGRHLHRRAHAGRSPSRVGVAYLAGLVVGVGSLAPLLGWAVVSLAPFIVAFAMFALPMAWSLAVGLAALALVVYPAVAVDSEETMWVVAFITFGILVMTAVVRVIEGRGQQFDRLSRELAIVGERERVARDVHDVLGHSLTVISVKAELASRLVDLDPERAKAELDQVQGLSRQALAEIRATVGGLRVARLENELAAARSALAGAGIEAEVPDVPDAVDPRHRLVLAWCLREGITNVVRHSGARSCRVELDSALLRVSDDGRGQGDRPDGNGIRGLRERVAASGGSLRIAPGPDGTGTLLEVRL